MFHFTTFEIYDFTEEVGNYAMAHLVLYSFDRANSDHAACSSCFYRYRKVLSTVFYLRKALGEIHSFWDGFLYQSEG